MSTLKELYKVICSHSDYVKLSKKSTEKVEAYKQKEKFFKHPWKFGKQVLDGIQPSGEPEFQKSLVRNSSRVYMWMKTEIIYMHLLLDLSAHRFPKSFLI